MCFQWFCRPSPLKLRVEYRWGGHSLEATPRVTTVREVLARLHGRIRACGGMNYPSALFFQSKELPMDDYVVRVYVRT